MSISKEYRKMQGKVILDYAHSAGDANYTGLSELSEVEMCEPILLDTFLSMVTDNKHYSN